MMPDSVLHEAGAHLRSFHRLAARRRQLRRSWQMADADLAQRQTQARAALEAIVAEHGPVETVFGAARRSRSVQTLVDSATLTAWAIEHRSGLLRPPTLTELMAAGAKWRGDMLVMESGEVVPGITQESTPSLSLAGPARAALADDNDDEEEGQ